MLHFYIQAEHALTPCSLPSYACTTLTVTVTVIGVNEKNCYSVDTLK